MWTRRDQLSAYSFLRLRLVHSLVVANPNHIERPGRRLVIATGAGAALAAVALAAVAIIGVVRPGNSTTWRSGGSIIVERESGARFVLDEGGTLHPALNYASALLFLGQDAATKLVSRRSLRGAPRGVPVGIAGAPDALPPAGALLDGPWTTCSRVPLDDTGNSRPVLAAQVGLQPVGAALPDGSSLLVRGAQDGSTYLVADGARYRVGGDDVLTALGYGSATVVQVAQGWLNVVPAGPDLEFLTVDGAGTPGAVIDGRRGTVGEVYELRELSGRATRFVLTQDGLRPVPGMAAALLLASPADSGRNPSGAPTPLTPSGAAQAAHSGQAGPGAGLPDDIPAAAVVDGDQVAVCATRTDGGERERLTVRLLPELPGLPGLATAAITSGAAAQAADLVMVTPGRGALLRAAVPGDPSFGPVWLVTDLGVRYPLADSQVATVLGYGDVDPVLVPEEFLALLPPGPELSFPAAPEDGPGVVTQAAAGG